MQFNLVVNTNTAGIGCWQRNGFQVVGTMSPDGAYLHIAGAHHRGAADQSSGLGLGGGKRRFTCSGTASPGAAQQLHD
jgi:hypothetical protein